MKVLFYWRPVNSGNNTGALLVEARNSHAIDSLFESHPEQSICTSEYFGF